MTYCLNVPTFRTNIGMAESDMHELCHFAPKKYLPTISEVCFFQSQGKMCKIETLRFLLFSEPMVLNKVTLWDFNVKTLKCVSQAPE